MYLFTYFYVRSPENKFYSDRFLDSSGTRALFSASYVQLFFDNQLPVPVAPEGDSAAPPNVLRTPAGSFCAPSPAPHIARCTYGVHAAEKSQSPKDDIWES